MLPTQNSYPNGNIFGFLPVEVLALVLQGYLSVEDISNLDVAICDANLRVVFLDAFQSLRIRDDEESGRRDNCVAWLIERNLTISNFKAHVSTFTRISADEMAAGTMKLDAIELLDFRFQDAQCFINNADMSEIVRHCPMLQSLYWKATECITDNAMTQIAEYCPKLQTLSLYNCPAITDIAR
jgi:hypothetical protein